MSELIESLYKQCFFFRIEGVRQWLKPLDDFVDVLSTPYLVNEFLSLLFNFGTGIPLILVCRHILQEHERRNLLSQACQYFLEAL